MYTINRMKKLNHICQTALIFCIFLFVCLGLSSCNTTQAVADNSESLSQDLSEPVVPTESEIAFEEQETVTAESEAALSETEEQQNPQEEINISENPEVQGESESEEKRIFEFKDQEVFYNIKYTYDYEVVGRDLDYKIIVNDEDKEIILQYEETDSEEDWQNNYKFLIWPLKLDNRVIWTSHGYARIYKSAENIPINEFCKKIEEHPDYKIIIRGWSLGSAMAKITARHFIIRTSGKVLIDELTTFGDVKCWLNPFYSNKKYCKRIREYVTGNDLITLCVPFYHRDVTCKVGDKFSLKKIRNSENYHTHYEDYDYSDWD